MRSSCGFLIDNDKVFCLFACFSKEILSDRDKRSVKTVELSAKRIMFITDTARIPCAACATSTLDGVETSEIVAAAAVLVFPDSDTTTLL